MSIINFILREKEVISTFDPEVYRKVRQLLDKHRFFYKVKSTYTGSGSRRTGNFVSFGEKIELQTQYQIFVKKSQYELVKHLLSKM
jgi:hypothetical protein